MSLQVEDPGTFVETDRRNPIGWILFGCLAALMIGGQLSSYLTRNPSTALLRARVEEELQTSIGLESMPDSSLAPTPVIKEQLDKAALELRPKLAGDPETTVLYAAVRMEESKPALPGELIAIRFSKDPIYQAAYQIYSKPTLDRGQAETLARQIPPKKFLYRLVAAHAYEKAKVPGPRKALGGAGGTEVRIFGFVALFVLLLLGLALQFAYWTARANGLLRPKGYALGRLTGPDADRVAMRSAQVFAAMLAIPVFGGAVLRGVIPKDGLEIPVYLMIVVAIVMLSRVSVGGKWISLRSMGVSRENLCKNILWGIGGAIANLPLIAAIQFISASAFKSLPAPEHPVTVELTDSASPLLILQIVLAAAVLAPVVEEVIFRGTLFPALGNVLKSPLWGGVITSLVFAAIHPTGIPAWPGLAMIGGTSCFLAYQTKSLVPSIVMHGVHNFGTLVFTLIFLGQAS